MNNLNLVSSSARAEQLRTEVRAFVDEYLHNVPADIRARSWLGFDADFSRALAQQGWVGMTFPEQYGGRSYGLLERFVLAEELLCRGAPVSAHWIADRQSGPLILRYGTQEQREFYLPRIVRGKAFFCIGMSEPNAGSDLASVRSRAEPTTDGWRLNGQKIWTTNAHHSHYMIALVRTSGRAEDRHEGLSQVIIDLSLPGVSIKPITDIAGDAGFSEVVFDNVQLPTDAILGAEGQGWEQVIAELGFERSGPERIYSSMVLLETWLQWLRQTPEVAHSAQQTLGRLLGWLAALRALSLGLTEKLAQGKNPVFEASLVKDLGTLIEQQTPEWMGDHISSSEAVAIPAELLRALSYLEQVAPSFSLRGGTREILRTLIARGLGLR